MVETICVQVIPNELLIVGVNAVLIYQWDTTAKYNLPVVVVFEVDTVELPEASHPPPKYDAEIAMFSYFLRIEH